jgi:mono/diheme cytochrome c family protein
MRLTSLLLLLSLSVSTASAQTQPGTTQVGESLYGERCAKCHESGVPRAANREALRHGHTDARR